MKEYLCFGSSKLTQHELGLASKCAQCGKEFLHTGSHVYKRTEGGRQLMYCSYTCFRVKAKEDEKKARERFEQSATSDQRREAQLKSRDRRKWGYKCGKNWEYVTFEDEETAKEYAAHAQAKIKRYEQEYRAAEPGTDAQLMAKRNIARWKRIKKNIKVKERTECTPEAEAL